MDNDELVTRAFNFENVRAMPIENTNYKKIEGHSAVFGQIINIGYYRETIERGAFDGCDFSDVLMCVNHSLDKIPLARCKNNSAASTLTLRVDEQGLFVAANLDIENNSEARSLVSAVERGDMSGMSFIFTIADAKIEDEDTAYPLRRILKIRKVYEVGVVSFPAYSNTDVHLRNKGSKLEDKELMDLIEVERIRSNIILRMRRGLL